MFRIVFIFAILSGFAGIAQTEHQAEIPDGTKVFYRYENTGAVSAEFSDGNYVYEWTEGPNAGASGSYPYQSLGMRDGQYMIQFMVAENGTFVTLIFDFDIRRVFASVLFAPASSEEFSLFETADLVEYELVEEK